MSYIFVATFVFAFLLRWTGGRQQKRGRQFLQSYHVSCFRSYDRRYLHMTVQIVKVDLSRNLGCRPVRRNRPSSLKQLCKVSCFHTVPNVLQLHAASISRLKLCIVCFTCRNLSRPSRLSNSGAKRSTFIAFMARSHRKVIMR